MDTLGHFLLLALGFGLVIFVHELGHFAVAKWVGIKVEQFAIGMGPALLAWRKGIGFRPGTTQPAYQALLRRAREGQPGIDLSRVGETEYRLNYLPFGGYVKMLGQEDLDMAAVVTDPRSYSSKPVWARMAVISAGVVMNMIFAVLLFVICFMWGVRTTPPVVGSVQPDGLAAVMVPTNAEALGIETMGLLPGDEFVSINGKTVDEFDDVFLAAAMAKPEKALRLDVRRGDDLLHFVVEPRVDRLTEFLAIGVVGSQSTTVGPLPTGDPTAMERIQRVVRHAGLENMTLKPGMVLTKVDGEPIDALWQFSRAIDESKGRPLELLFLDPDTDSEITGTITPDPDAMLAQVQVNGGWYPLHHLLGLVPAVVVTEVQFEEDGDDEDAKARVEPDDVIVRIGDTLWPREDEVTLALARAARGTIDLTVLRDGLRMEATLPVDRNGFAGFIYQHDRRQPALVADMLTADDLPPARAGDSAASRDSAASQPATTALAGAHAAIAPGADLNLPAGTRITALDGRPVETWRDVQLALRAATDPQAADASVVTLSYELPLPGRPAETSRWTLPREAVARLHALGWHNQLSPNYFEPLERVMKADHPIEAVRMGLAKTWDMVVMTYATLDRLVRGTVKVDQLKGPVGIAQIGTQVAGQGFIQLLVFLGVINVNLAVLNFLPIPIVDGGLMVFLLIEKLKGSPVSANVQNWATLAGIAIIGSVFVVTFYNDVLNLVHGLGG